MRRVKRGFHMSNIRKMQFSSTMQAAINAYEEFRIARRLILESIRTPVYVPRYSTMYAIQAYPLLVPDRVATHQGAYKLLNTLIEYKLWGVTLVLDHTTDYLE